MIVTVRLFARARDLAGQDTLKLELSPGADVAELRRRLASAWPALTPLLPRCALAVNNEFAEDTTPLSPNAQIAVLPPVSGGAP
jgi:molybdopterin converting factor subunit 1